ncbi:homeodomain-like protein [Tanacetum coccineum]
MEEINNLQQEPDETLYQAWKRFKEQLMKCPQHYLTDMQEVILFYNGLEVPTRQILDSKGAIPTKTAVDAKVAIQEMVEYSQKWHNGTSKIRRGQYRATTMGFYQRSNANPSYQERRQSMEESLSKFINESAKRHEENSNMIKEIQASTDAAIRNQGALIKTLEIQTGQMSKGSYGLKDLDAYSIITTLRNDALPRKEKDPGIGIGKFFFPTDFIILDMPEDVNVPLILGRPFLSTAHAKVDVFKRKITLRVGDEKIILKSVKPTGSLIKRVYMLSLREIIDLDLEARLMGETLNLNRSFNPLYRDYIELNDLNEPQELRRNRVNDLEPTIEEGEVVNEHMKYIVKTRCDFIGGLDDYPSDCDFDRRIHIDCACNLKFSYMIGFEFVHVKFLLILPINVVSKKFYNSMMKDKIEFKWRNELGNFVNAPVFIGNFYVITNFTVVEDMDPYLDEGMRDVIVGEPFCKASCVEARRFDGIITIRDGNDSVTYQMVSPYDVSRIPEIVISFATSSYATQREEIYLVWSVHARFAFVAGLNSLVVLQRVRIRVLPLMDTAYWLSEQ